MLKFFGLLFVVGVAFAIGYQVGREGPDVLLKHAKDLSTEVMTRATALERTTSMRTGLLKAKEHMVQAKSDILDKNYGKAVSGLQESEKALTEAKAAAQDDIRPRIDALAAKISHLASDAQGLKPGMMTKLNEAIREVDALLNR
jgi:uncharacterized coiled-coil DUF342 family protein